MIIVSLLNKECDLKLFLYVKQSRLRCVYVRGRSIGALLISLRMLRLAG